jgi:hypothetical protein
VREKLRCSLISCFRSSLWLSEVSWTHILNFCDLEHTQLPRLLSKLKSCHHSLMAFPMEKECGEKN